MRYLKNSIVTILFLASFKLVAQEVLSPLTYRPIFDNSNARGTEMVLFPTDTIALPSVGVRDNFMYDSRRPDSTMWDLALNPGVYVNRGWATAPINLGVCTFDGLNAQGFPYDQFSAISSSMLCDELTSRHFDLSGYSPSDSVYLSFWWEAQGKGYAPNQVDSLQVQVNIPAWNTAGEVWKTVWFMEGYNPQFPDTSFHVAMIKLDSASYFANGFRFRFRNYASGCGSNDHWHIDEVLFKPNRLANDTFINDVFFVYDMPSLFQDFQEIPGSHYTASQMANNINMYIRNNDTITRNVTYSFEIFAVGNSTPLFNYAGGADGNLFPFDSSGYSTYAPHENPNFSYSYTPFSVPDTGYYYVNHMLKKGTAPTSPVDTVTYYQRMYNAYAYDDGSAEVGYGLYGSGGLLAYRFDLPIGVLDTLTAIQMHFLPVLDIDVLQYREFRLTVWNHNVSTSGPGTIIYQERGESPYYAPDVSNRFTTYGIDSGIVVLSGTFYIGWQQEGVDRLYIGMDLENDNHSKVYYNTSGVWYTSIYPGSLMMRPVFGDDYDVSGIEEGSSSSAISVYPNPSSQLFLISGLSSNQNYSATLVDIYGREVIRETVNTTQKSINVSAFAPGMYILRITDEAGKIAGVERVIIE